jgi:steroid delta-isomerase-like uncharacterized protein
MTDKTVLVRRLFDDVWNRGRLDLVNEIVTDTYVDHDPTHAVTGPDGLRSLVKTYRDAFPDCRLDIEETLTAGDRLVVRWRYSGTHSSPLQGIPPTGRRVQGPGISIYRFQGDRIAESHTTWDALGMMQQLGVVTLPGKSVRVGQ